MGDVRSTGQPACPRCGGPLERIRRRWVDRLLSLLIPVRRYHCYSMGCNWTGRLRVRDHPLAESDAARRYDRRVDPP